MTENEYKGNCFCGKVEFSLKGSPAAMGYCHCADCRQWAAAPFIAASLWPKEAFHIARGEDQVATFNKTPQSTRAWCKACGGHLYNDHPHWKLIDVYPVLIKGLAFKPAVHVNYAECIFPVKDGLPKFKDFPENLGGSGETVNE